MILSAYPACVCWNKLPSGFRPNRSISFDSRTPALICAWWWSRKQAARLSRGALCQTGARQKRNAKVERSRCSKAAAPAHSCLVDTEVKRGRWAGNNLLGEEEEKKGGKVYCLKPVCCWSPGDTSNRKWRKHACSSWNCSRTTSCALSRAEETTRGINLATSKHLSPSIYAWRFFMLCFLQQ